MVKLNLYFLDGLSYAYIRLNIIEKELDEIGEEIGNYSHLRDVNISNNKFTHIDPLQYLTYLVRLDASKNEIKQIEMFSDPEKFQFLKILNLNTNKIKELPPMNMRYVTDINLESNIINTANRFNGLPELVRFNLKQNKLKDCLGLANMSKLISLFLVLF